MANTDGLSESEVRQATKKGTSDAVKATLSTIFWTLLALFSTLVGLQSVQMAFYTNGLAVPIFATVGGLITAASVYLLYLLHWA